MLFCTRDGMPGGGNETNRVSVRAKKGQMSFKIVGTLKNNKYPHMLTITSLITGPPWLQILITYILHPWSVSMQSLAATNSFPRVILSEVDNLFDLHSLKLFPGSPCYLGTRLVSSSSIWQQPHSQAVPTSSFCILQAIKNWRQEQPGNKANLMSAFIHAEDYNIIAIFWVAFTKIWSWLGLSKITEIGMAQPTLNTAEACTIRVTIAVVEDLDWDMRLSNVQRPGISYNHAHSRLPAP